MTRTREKFEEFFHNFIDPHTAEPMYPQQLREIVQSSSDNININCKNIFANNPELYSELVNFPTEVIPIFDLCINRIRNEELGGGDEAKRIQVRPFELHETRNMRILNPEDIDTLVGIKGMVIRCGSIIPELKKAFFQCLRCNWSKGVDNDNNVINEPIVCDNCKARRTMQLIHNRGLFHDKQMIKLQETPDSIPEGETPHTITVYAYDDLVDVAKPGDRIEITGIYRAQASRVNPRVRMIRDVYRTHLDAIHIKKIDARRMQAEDAKVEKESEFYTSFDESDTATAVRAEQERKLDQLSQDPRIMEKLIKSIAPSIFEMEHVKKGLLCQLFGGSNNNKGAKSGQFRGEINVLMCGDPGTSKSQLLQYVHKIAPRGIYTSGKGSSAVGLTAYITKDPLTKELVLESGALVLSDRGVCCIDEFDKMSDSTRSILHEVMEQQTVSIAKAGIVCTLNARTSILASANPKQSRYNPRMSVIKNIELGPTLLSRFDLIYIILDQPNEALDRKLAMHLASFYNADDEQVPSSSDEDIISKEVLAAYISRARKHIVPKLTEAAENELVSAYTKMRSGNAAGKGTISATPRQLESLIRLSESFARMVYSEEVTAENVIEAVKLMEIATQAAATDPTTGQIDMMLLTTGLSAADRNKEMQQLESIKDLLSRKQGQRAITVMSLLGEFNKNKSRSVEDVTPQEMVALLKTLAREGVVEMGRNDDTFKIIE